jgi:hypothetical protein
MCYTRSDIAGADRELQKARDEKARQDSREKVLAELRARAEEKRPQVAEKETAPAK